MRTLKIKESSGARKVQYDVATQTMIVTFATLKRYQYSNVGEDVVEDIETYTKFDKDTNTRKPFTSLGKYIRETLIVHPEKYPCEELP